MEDDQIEEDNQTTDDLTVDNQTEEEEEGETVVIIDEDGFNPSEIEISVGETVTWINQDDSVHTVTGDALAFDSGELAEGESYSYTFDEAGTFEYESEEDFLLSGTITVTEEDNNQTTQDQQENGDVVVVPTTE
ncbi:hypothetical protein CUN85_04155 [Methanolobus halotolerans]|uniref:EfeO-type cupredoxin-like domain-containing protein n=2 Tax=Methanolobus halotolerans TaxID=2052935 RepID=A0A4E0Q7A4_9EURY|nr:hypothetical protein CUN85_04155 [Methanolobus halotolerans]